MKWKYLRNNPKELFDLSVFLYSKLYSEVYTYYRKNHCQVGQIGEKKYFQTFKSFLNSTSFNNDLKQCLKICQISGNLFI